MLLGLTAIFQAVEGHCLEACWLVALCVLLDKADGTAARLLNATSDIGMQLDSFSDFVTFGIAPATVVFMALYQQPVAEFPMWQGAVNSWMLRILVATYVLCTAIRLAKFNVLVETGGPKHVFYGLATTFCGAFVVLAFIVLSTYEAWELLNWLPLACGLMALLMVSNFPMPKIQKASSNAVNVFVVCNSALAYVFGIFRIYPEYLLGLLVVYLVAGFCWGFVNREELKAMRLDPYPD